MSEGAQDPGREREERLRRDLAALHLPRDRHSDDGNGRTADSAWRVRALRLGASVLLPAALFAIGWAGWRLLSPPPLRVEVAAVAPYSAAAEVPVPVLSGSGYLVPAQPSIAIGSRIAGRIRRYHVDEGDPVDSGAVLVELEAAPYRAVVQQLEAGLTSARAQADLAERELERAQRLFGEGVISQEAIDRRESEARVAAAAVTELNASLERARIDLDDTIIRAPTDGVVLEIFKQPGEVAVPGGFSGSGDLLRLANLEELRAELDVNEVDLVHISMGQRAEVTPDAFPETVYAAAVVELAPQIDRQKGTREVEVRILDPDDKLLPDMSVRVVFLSRLGGEPGAASGALGGEARGAVIPRAALRRDGGGRAFVWAVEAGRARRIAIEVADVLGERVVVSDGLLGGEQVIVGAQDLREGAPVEVSGAGER